MTAPAEARTVVTVRIGDPGYEQLLGQLRDDQALLNRMWADAESRLDEQPGKLWAIAVVDGVPAAWAAAVVEVDDGAQVLRCCNNYERPAYRGRGLYAAAYAHRHATVVLPSHLPGVTYLFAQPIGVHEADGWYRTGVTGWSAEQGAEPHEWWQLRRDVEPARSTGGWGRGSPTL